MSGRAKIAGSVLCMPQMSIKASSERLLGLECKLRNAVSQVACVDAPFHLLQRFTTFLSVTLSLGVGTTILSEFIFQLMLMRRYRSIIDIYSLSLIVHVKWLLMWWACSLLTNDFEPR